MILVNLKGHLSWFNTPVNTIGEISACATCSSPRRDTFHSETSGLLRLHHTEVLYGHKIHAAVQKPG